MASQNCTFYQNLAHCAYDLQNWLSFYWIQQFFWIKILFAAKLLLYKRGNKAKEIIFNNQSCNSRTYHIFFKIDYLVRASIASIFMKCWLFEEGMQKKIQPLCIVSGLNFRSRFQNVQALLFLNLYFMWLELLNILHIYYIISYIENRSNRESMILILFVCRSLSMR